MFLQTLNYLPREVSKTTTYTATIFDDTIYCSTSGGAWTLSLYAAANNIGRQINIIKTTSDVYSVTISPNGADTISGAASTSVDTQYESLILIATTGGWVIKERHIPEVLTSFSVYFRGQSNGLEITNQVSTGKWYRRKNKIFIDILTSITGAPGGGTGYVYWEIPASSVVPTIKSADLMSTLYNKNVIGHFQWYDASATWKTGEICYDNASGGLVAIYTGATTLITVADIANNDAISMRLELTLNTWKAT
jgi:hypothetical protein